MSKNVEYMIVHSPSITGLENAVGNYIREGWELQGGVFAAPLVEDSADHEGYSYMQAMIRPIPQDFVYA